MGANFVSSSFHFTSVGFILTARFTISNLAIPSIVLENIASFSNRGIVCQKLFFVKNYFCHKIIMYVTVSIRDACDFTNC